jgi:hypothetical protein
VLRWAFSPKSKFKLTAGAAKQGDYQFNKMRLHHHFCTKCGIESYAEATGPDGLPTASTCAASRASMSTSSPLVRGTAAASRLLL